MTCCHLDRQTPEVRLSSEGVTWQAVYESSIHGEPCPYEAASLMRL
jgi:hypothetical protein